MFTASHPYYSTDPYQPTITQGGENATVTFYWGDNNGSTTPANWDNNQQISGTHGVGVVNKALTGLTKGTTYYYTSKVSNSGGSVWGDVKTFVPANTALNKDTIPDLALWLDATDINGDGNADSISDGTTSPLGSINPMHLPFQLHRLPQRINLCTKLESLEQSRAFDLTDQMISLLQPPFVRLQVVIMYL